MNECKIIFGTGASSGKTIDELYPVVKEALSDGIRGFDSAPSYGTEEVLGECLSRALAETGQSRKDIFIQTKIDEWQMMEGKEKIRLFTLDAMRKLQTDYLDSLLIHWPLPECFDDTWESLKKIKEEGIVKRIGVCNVRMRQLNAYLSRGELPDIIQIERNPLRICEREVKFCVDHGIWVQAYSPLCKMHDDIRNSTMLAKIAEKHGKNIGQVVMRWHMDTGVTPVFTSKKPSRVREYSQLNDFALEKEEIKLINGINRDYKMYLESVICPGY